ncbi:MAG: hypothetical protein EBR40_11015 [Proteobacteria bacterium]|nr:hypothetical protein [Pseudomonadota bacterium]
MTETVQEIALTERQREILDFIGAFWTRSGFCPTVREICREFEFASPNAAWTHMNALKRHGLITWQSGQARTIRPTEAGVSLLEGGDADG